MLIHVDPYDLRPAARNPNAMSPAEETALRASIVEMGFAQPILVRPVGDTHEIIDGHHRIDAVRALLADGHEPEALGLEGGKVPAVVVEGLSEAQALALGLGMNRIRGRADLATVAEILSDLQDYGWSTSDMLVTGFDEQEIADLLTPPSEVDAAEILASSRLDDLEERPAPTGTIDLVIPLQSGEQVKAVRKALHKASGDAKDIGVGLLALLGMAD